MHLPKYQHYNYLHGLKQGEGTCEDLSQSDLELGLDFDTNECVFFFTHHHVNRPPVTGTGRLFR